MTSSKDLYAASNVLRRSLDLLEENGWTQGSWTDHCGNCALRAVNACADWSPEGISTNDPAYRYLLNAGRDVLDTDERMVTKINDNMENFDQVRAWFRLAIKNLRLDALKTMLHEDKQNDNR